LNEAKEAGQIILFPVSNRSEGEDEVLQGLALGIGGQEIVLPVFLNRPFFHSEKMRHLLEDPAIRKTGHDLKYCFLLLQKEGVKLDGIYFDTMLASYLIHPNQHRHALDEIAMEHLQVNWNGPHDRKRAMDLALAAPSACEAVSLLGKLKDVLASQLEKFELNRLFFELEMPLVTVLAEMEWTGIKLDISLLETLSKELEIQIERLIENIYRLSGERFNINSPKQLAEILFERLNLKPGKKTKTGYSTDEKVLTQLALQNELPGEILNYRQLTKLKSTYVDVLPKLVKPSTGRLHTTFDQVTAATGRLSSNNPNLQNIPIRGEWGLRVRDAFIADPGWMMVSADYNQIELRILAHLSQDRQLSQSFKEGEDIHRRTASQIFQVAPDAVTREMRRAAKTINFGILYGMGAFSLASDLGITVAEAKKYIENYFKAYHGVRNYIDQTIAVVKEKGYVTTLLNRRRSIPELNSPVASVRSFGERLAINTPIQGSAADLIKLAMVSIGKKIRGSQGKIKMVLQIHDELLFEAAENDLDEIKGFIRKEMEEIIKLSVPITVDIGVGHNWREAH
ncbi:MAG: DNA polymerase I, partial [Nitrospirae bacterium]|nr:DNA polymerase I [Nitrospirota bacterium]